MLRAKVPIMVARPVDQAPSADWPIIISIDSFDDAFWCRADLTGRIGTNRRYVHSRKEEMKHNVEERVDSHPEGMRGDLRGYVNERSEE